MCHAVCTAVLCRLSPSMRRAGDSCPYWCPVIEVAGVDTVLEVLPRRGVGACFDDALFEEVNGGEVAEFGEVSGSVFGSPAGAHVGQFVQVVGDPHAGFAGDFGQVPLVGFEPCATQELGDLVNTDGFSGHVSGSSLRPARHCRAWIARMTLAESSGLARS